MTEKALTAKEFPVTVCDMSTKNPNAVALGKLAVGFKKTMTPAAMAQRKAASKLGVEARQAKAKEKEKLK